MSVYRTLWLNRTWTHSARHFLVVLLCAGLLVPYFPASLVYAEESTPAESSATNTNTGADTTNTSESNIESETNITNQNDAVTYTNAYLKSETGNNVASFNTRSGIITTEKAEGRGELINLINNNVVNVASNPPQDATASNQNTGADSINEATVNITNETVVKNINTASTVNRVVADVISGKNEASENTGHGTILSGQARLGLNFMSLANTNFVNVKNLFADSQNVFGNHAGNIDFARATATSQEITQALLSISNKNTGAGSTNNATVNINDETVIVNSNTGKLENHIQANVISGQNKANRNTGTGSVATGNVQSSVNVMNFLNANITASNFWLKSLNVFGNWSGNINLPKMPAPNLTIAPYTGQSAGINAQTGANTENEASVEETNQYTQTNQNEAQINNTFLVKSGTGDNVASFNNGSGAVKFGDALAQTNTANAANINVTGDSWWILIINKFGNWQGTTIGSPSDMVVNAGGSATVLSPTNSGIEVFNDATGPDSNNYAGATINHATEIINENAADITNAITVNAISGENQAEYNGGHGYIEVGDVKSAVNAMNIANVNVNVGNVLIAMVNVFGDWSGNIVFNSGLAAQTGTLDFSQFNSAPAAAFNQGTGSGSTSNAQGSLTNATNINNQNNAITNNNASAISSSGQNAANYNTGLGVVSTGASGTASSFLNKANNNALNVGQGSCSGATAGSDTTGATSQSASSASNTCATDITNDNNSQTNNNVVVNNSTGNNVASYNTGNGVVDTSWVDTFVQLYNQSNENQITVGQVEAIVDSGTEDEATGGENNSDSSAGDTTGGDTDTESSIDANSGNENESGDGSTSDTGGTDQTGQDAQEETATTGSENTGNAGNGTSGQNNSTTQENSSSNNQGNQNTQNTQGNQNNQNSNNSNTQNGGAGTGAGGPSPAPASQQTPAVGTCSPTRPKGDINGDGKVDFYDLSIIMGNWSKKVKKT